MGGGTQLWSTFCLRPENRKIKLLNSRKSKRSKHTNKKSLDRIIMRDLVTLHRFYGATFSAVWPCYRSSNHCRGGKKREKKPHLPSPQCELNSVSHTSSDRLSVSCCPPVPLRHWHRSQFHCHAISTLAAPSRTSFHLHLRCSLQHFELCWLVALQP